VLVWRTVTTPASLARALAVAAAVLLLAGCAEIGGRPRIPESQRAPCAQHARGEGRESGFPTLFVLFCSESP
jgi:hypothetical protein